MTAPSTMPLASYAASWLARQALESVVQIADGRAAAGSGVIVDPSGLIVTNAHVVRNRPARVRLHDGLELEGRIIARDEAVDLAALRIERDELDAIEFGDSNALRSGQIVIAIGHPLGLTDAVSLGVVSRAPDEGDDRALIASNVTLNRGNSGGPLLDATGRMLGINAMVAGPGLGLSIPSRTVRRFLAWHVDPRPLIGMSVQWHGSDSRPGLIVTDIQPESPAEAVGLLPGDLIVGVAGNPARGPHALIDGLVDTGIGGDLHLAFERAGQAHAVRATVVAKA